MVIDRCGGHSCSISREIVCSILVQAVIQARLAARVLELDGWETVGDGRCHHRCYGVLADLLVHSFGCLVHVAVRAAQVTGIGHMEPCRQDLAAGKYWLRYVSGGMNDVELAQPGYHILEIITSRIIARCGPICPHLAQGCRLLKATEDCMPRF